MNHDLPVMLRVRGRSVVIVGGGSVAKRRAASLLDSGATVTVIAPVIDSDLAAMNIIKHQRPYQGGDLRGAFLVIIATDDPAANAAAAEEAEREGVLVNRADEPELGDVTVPAHTRIGPVTVSVGSGGISPRAAAHMRDQMLIDLDRDWLVLLQTLEPVREKLQETVPDIRRRREAMHKLTDPAAMALLKEKGVDGLRRFADHIIEDAQLRP
jgi:siroheme synthase-like protein